MALNPHRPPEPSDAEDPPEIPLLERVDLAVQRWKNANAGDANSTLSMRKAAKQYGVPRSTLDDRINGRVTTQIARQNRQKLTPEEELVVARWILRLQRWGWPPRVE